MMWAASGGDLQEQIFCAETHQFRELLQIHALFTHLHQALEELRSFMIVKGVALKKRQKLMRNLRVSSALCLSRVGRNHTTLEGGFYAMAIHFT